MVRKLAMTGGLAMLVAVGVAVAGTPFGGDDTGKISSTPAVNKCESKVAKAVAKLVASLGKCTAAVVNGKATDDEACEAAALTKFGSTSTTGCASCTNLATLGPLVEGLVDSNNNKVYCTATGTPFGGDDTGNVPPDAATKGPIAKCENKVNKATGKLVGGIIKCHVAEASGKGDDEACEGAALTKFGSTVTTGCDSCTNLATLGAFVEMTVDGANATVFCGSPSGAFLD